jgi:hypothetical protein
MGEGKRIMEAEYQEAGERVAYLPPSEGKRSLRVLGELVTYKNHQLPDRRGVLAL